MNLSDLINHKVSFNDSGLLIGATDIHCHILPGVDDGIKTYDEAVESLRWLNKQGIGEMYLTPHIMSDFTQNTHAYLSQRYKELINKLENDGIKDIPKLKLAAEYMLDFEFEKHKKNGLLTYSDNHVLVETSYMMSPIGFNDILETLMEDGYLPVLAHPERYVYMENNDYKHLKTQGVQFQLNFLSLTGAYGRYAQKKANLLLKEQFYNYIGSDFHCLMRHEDNFLAKSISKKMIPSLRTLFDNNRNLW